MSLSSSTSALAVSPRRRRPRRRRRPLVALMAFGGSLVVHGVLAAVLGISYLARQRHAADTIDVEIVEAAELPAPAVMVAPAAPPLPSSPLAATRTRAAARMSSRPLTSTSTSTSTSSPAARAPAPVATREPPAPGASPAPAGLPATFAMSAGVVAGRGDPRAPGDGHVGPSDESGAGTAGVSEILPESAVGAPARLLSRRPEVYPPAARNAEVEGDVALEIVVGTDGQVSDARVLQARGYGLDAAATQAVRGYHFSPARRAGRPVRVRMRWIVQFRLR